MNLAFLQIKLVCCVFVENNRKKGGISVDILIDDNGRGELLLLERSPIRELSQ